ncbi:pea pathogenicity protein, partial [Eremomyces bilateralis CBS 781.70]
SEHLQTTFKLFWLPGTNLAVDEAMARFTGRAAEIVNIPSKPTPKGFKIWVLADQGYILDWLFH